MNPSNWGSFTMNKGLMLLILAVFAGSALLSACGPLELYLEPGPATPVPTSEPTFTPTPTLAPTPTPIVALTGLLQGGLPLTIIQTRMLSAQTGWGVARVDTDLYDHILLTADGGQTWKDRTPQAALNTSPDQALVVTTYFASSQLAWAAYYPTAPSSDPPIIWRTIDGGQSWASSQPLDLDLSGRAYQPVQLGFRDGRNGWLMARIGGETGQDDVAVFLTSDGGYQWIPTVSPQTHPELMECSKTGLAFPIQGTGWMAGDCRGTRPGLFFSRTADNGRTWQPVELPVPTGQAADFFASPANQCGIPGFVYVSTRSLILTVRCQNAAGVPTAWIYASGDSGQTWASRPLPAAYGFFSFANPDEGWYLASDDPSFAQGGFLHQTTDGGRSWNTVTPVGWSGPINFVDANNGWVIAHTTDREALVRTTNGGRSWLPLRPLSVGQ